MLLLGGYTLTSAAQGIPKASATDPISDHFRAAESFQLASDYAQAEREYKLVLALALHRAGREQLALGSYLHAVESLESALAIQPDSLPIISDLAIAELWRGNLEHAEALAKTLDSSEAATPQTHALLGRIALARNDVKTAIQELQRAHEKQPDFDTAYNLALAHLQAKNLPPAQALFDELVATAVNKADARVFFGHAYLETNYVRQAMAEFQMAIKLDPTSSKAYSQLGLAYLREGGADRFPEARQAFAKALRLSPSEYSANFYLGVIRLQSRDLLGAQRALNIAARSMPTSPDPYLYLGQINLETRQFPLAVSALKKSIALTADAKRNQYQVARAHYLLAQAYAQMNRSAEAATERQRASEIRALEAWGGDASSMVDDKMPWLRQEGQASASAEAAGRLLKPQIEGSPSALRDPALLSIIGNSYHNLGVIYAQRADYETGCQNFTAAAKWDRKISALERNWALACFRAKKFDVAVVPLQGLLSKSRSDAGVREMLGTSYYMTDQHAKAAQVFRPLAASPPDNPGVLYAMGVAFVRSGDPAAGASVFRRMLERHPNVPEVHLLLGEAYAKQDDEDNALKEFRTSLELNPQTQGVHSQIGQIFIRQRKMQEAAGEFRQELDTNPTDVSAKYELAYALLEDSKIDEAIGFLNEVIQATPDRADAYYQLGRAMLAKGDAASAVDQLQTAVRLDPQQDYGYYQLGMAYRKLGRTKDAEEALKKFQTLKRLKRARPTPKQ